MKKTEDWGQRGTTGGEHFQNLKTADIIPGGP